MTSGPPILTPPTSAPSLGPAVALAERALTRLLAGVLAETGTPALTWYAFQRLAVFETAPSPAAFRRDLSDNLDLDDSAATALLDEIVTTGLMQTPGDGALVALTEAGEALRDRIRASAAALAGELTASLDPADVATTIRTLTTITGLARELAGPAQ